MATVNAARTEFASALTQIASERGIEVTTIIDAIKEAIKAAYRKDWLLTNAESEFLEENFDVEVNEDTGESRIFDITDGKRKDVTPPGFDHIPAQTPTQDTLQQVTQPPKIA